MDMIAVDPKLFITCRLCLDETGCYQIVPKVQEQIKYCFDIDVDPFDRLPQLICKKCQAILSEYYTTKTNFNTKQNALKIRIESTKDSGESQDTQDADATTHQETIVTEETPQQETVSSSQQHDNETSTPCSTSRANSSSSSQQRHDNETSKPCSTSRANSRRSSLQHVNESRKPCATSRRNSRSSSQPDNETSKPCSTSRVNSRSSSQQHDSETSKPCSTSRVNSRSHSRSSSAASDILFVNSSSVAKPVISRGKQTWQEKYFKRYGCRLCSKICIHKGNMRNHLRKHDRLKARHHDVLKIDCKVVLDKIDGKPNLTGGLNNVMFNTDKIVCDEERSDFFTIYSSRDPTDKKVLDEGNIATRQLKSFPRYDSSDDDAFVTKAKRKRCRLISDSSKETVVLEGDKESSDIAIESNNDTESKTLVSNEIDCINIDDSSDTESCVSNVESNNMQNMDTKQLQSIILKCYNKHIQKKKSANRPENLDCLLKTKILSMGIKSLNPSNPINCTGLLRYMEYKNLDIKWIPITKNSYGRIMPKMKSKDDSCDDNLRWKDLPGDSVSNPLKFCGNKPYSFEYFTNRKQTNSPKQIISQKQTNSHESAYKLPSNIVSPCDTSIISVSSSEQSKGDFKDQKSIPKPVGPSNKNNSLHKLDEHSKQKKSSPKRDGNSKENKSLPKQDEHPKENKSSPRQDEHPTENKSSAKQDEHPTENKSSPKQDEHSKENKSSPRQDGHSKENKPLPKPGGNAVLYSYMTGADSDMKLLNASPVANPKQLPKKINLTEVKNVKSLIDAVVVQSAQQIPLSIGDEEHFAGSNVDEPLCMPIITSTTSLALAKTNRDNEKEVNDKNHTESIISNNDASKNKELEKNPFRIKVKPASELMSEQALNNLSSQSHATQHAVPSMWHTNQSEPVSFESHNMANNARITPGGLLMTSGQAVPVTYESAPTEKPRECVILDTVELPNTKTDSPFQYFQKLLFIHSIILLDTIECFSRDFVRLTKFKMVFNEESVQRQVVLSLALHCSGKEFCLQVIDQDQNNINMRQLTAYWQWEIIKVFKGDVENNLLKNAQKSSQNMYEYTKSFLCVLKSINFKTITS